MIFRARGQMMLALIFFIIAATLFPLSIGPEPQLLQRISVGVLWTVALFASLLSLEPLFQDDYEDGSLDLMILAPCSLSFIVASKLTAHFLASGLPLLILTPFLGLLLNLPPESLPILLLSMAVGLPCMTLIGGLGAALGVGAKRRSSLIIVIVLPLLIPLLIFAVGGVENSTQGLGANGAFQVLFAMLILLLVFVPPVIAAILRRAVAA